MNRLSKEFTKSLESHIRNYQYFTNHLNRNNNNNINSVLIKSNFIKNQNEYNNILNSNIKNNRIINRIYHINYSRTNLNINNNNNNNYNRYYSSNVLLNKNQKIIYNIFSSKSLTAFLLFCYFNTIPQAYYVVIPVFLLRMFEIAMDTSKTIKFYEYSMIQIQKHRDKIQSNIGRPFQVPPINKCKFYRHNNSSSIGNNSNEQFIDISGNNINNINEKKKKKDSINNNNQNYNSNKSGGSNNNEASEFSNQIIQILTDIKDTPKDYLNYYHKNKNFMVCKFDVLDSNQPDSKSTIEVICNYIPTTFKDLGKKTPLEQSFTPKFIKIILNNSIQSN